MGGFFAPSYKPNRYYSNKNREWKGWGYFLNTGNVMNKYKTFPTYEETKEIIENFNIKSNKEWRMFSKTDGKKLNLPSAPDRTYKNNGWISWKDFFKQKRV